MRIAAGLCAVMCIAGSAMAQTQTIDFEACTAGVTVVGQDGWTQFVGSNANAFVVDNATVSPMNGSTKSLRMDGVLSANRIVRAIGTPVSAGVWRVGHDWRYTGNTGSTPPESAAMSMMTILYQNTAGAQQLTQPYFLDGDNGTTEGGAGLNFAGDLAPLANGYGFKSPLPDFRFSGSKWYRFEWTMDFDQHLLMDLTVYDISTGSKVQVANYPGTYYFGNNGTAWYGTFNQFAVRSESFNAGQSWWIDNFSISPTTLPAPVIGAPPLWAKVNVPFNKAVTLLNPQPVTWTLVSRPAGAVIDPTTGVISGWTPTTAGSKESFTVRATNTYGVASAPKTFTVTVLGQYELVNIPYDAQIDAGAGPAITPVSLWSFLPADETTTAGFGRCLLAEGFGAHEWFWDKHMVDLTKAGFGASVDMSSCYTRIDVDLRYSKLDYGDAPLAVRLYDTNGKARGFDWYYNGRATGPLYPEWQHCTYYLNSWNASPWQSWWISDADFDPSHVCRIGWFGTDWNGVGNDYFDVQRLVITNAPVPPVIAPVTPDPQAAFVNTPYSKQMSVTPCSDITWTLVATGTTATIDANGLISGWAPTAGQLGQTFTFVVTATGPGVASQITYHVKVKAQQVADGGPDSPWGTLHANNSGTQSSDDPRLILNKHWAAGAVVDTEFGSGGSLGLASLNVGRATERSSIVFDAQGNLYWRSIGNPCYLASVTAAGVVRWVGNVSGTPWGLGRDNTSTPVVGDGQRVYVVTNDGVAAFNKADGDLLWQTALSGCEFPNHGDCLTPVLYNGKLYVVSSGQPAKTIYQVDSLTGVLDWSSPFTVDIDTGWGELRGQMCLVPDALGAGIHGLYFNGDAGSSGKGMYCVSINPASGATLAWSDRGGKVARSHVIYLASAGRVCTHTWNDYGSSFYSWNLDGSQLATTLAGNGSHGYEDFGALDFDGNDVLSVGSDGRIVRYADITVPGDPMVPTQVVYDCGGFENLTLGTLIGQDNWGRDNSGAEPDAQIVDDPTSSGHGKVIAFVPTGSGQDDSGPYVGAVRPAACTAGNVVTIEWDQYLTDSKGLLWLADNTAYNGWWSVMRRDGLGLLSASSWDNGKQAVTPAVWQHVKYTINPAAGIVTFQIGDTISTGATGDAQIDGIDFEYGPGPNAAGPMYVDNIVIKQGPASAAAFGANGWYQSDSRFGESRGVGGMYKDENGDTICIHGTDPGQMSTRLIGFNVTKSVMYTTSPGAASPADDEPMVFQYDTGLANHPYGGPVVGPSVTGVRQHIYYFPDDFTLVALTHVRPIPGDFNGDKDVDVDDYRTFMDCVGLGNGPTVMIVGTDCANRDLDGDLDIDLADFGIFQRCFTGAGVQGNPDCAK